MCDTKRELIKASWLPVEKAMQEQGLTIVSLAKKAKINHSTLYCWANGIYKPKVDKIINVCNVLGLNYKDFI